MGFKNVDNHFFLIIFFIEECRLSQKKYCIRKKTVITLNFFFRKLSFQSFRKSKNAKSLSSRYTFIAIKSKIFFLRASIWLKKVINLIKFSETDFRIRLVESQNHGMKLIFLGQPKTACSRSHKYERKKCEDNVFHLDNGK